MAHAMIGAQGILAVGQQTAKPPVTTAAPAAPVTAPAAAPANAAASSGPYKFDPAHGATLYANTCVACHQTTGMGLTATFPALKGNAVVLDPDPTKHISVVLNGLSGEVIDGVTYPTVMPPFGSALSDADVADIVNHERTSWDNQGKLITADQVKAVRAKGTGK
jgi:nitrite reductase (NO-forming)